MQVNRSALLPYSAMQMYEIVADVEQYPTFLGWCEEVQIVEGGRQEAIAQMKVSYGKLKIQFTTRNLNTPGESIVLKLKDGPFKNLQGSWSFKPLNERACKVSIDMDFDFDTRIVPGMVGRVFEKVIATQLDAFQKRAKQIYGDGYA